MGIAADNPYIAWQEIESDHFIVFYPQSRENFARRAIAIAEEAFEQLSRSLEWMPEEKTFIRIGDHSDEANGWARSVPQNEIFLYAYPPEMESELWHYGDWMRQLIYHELTHILHTDTSHAPIHRALNDIFGKFARPNAAAPRWYTEGIAVYYETRFGKHGRLRNALYHIMMRQAALAGKIPSLGELSMGMARWPGGAGAYIFGAHFVAYIVQKYGLKSLTQWNHTYGAQWLPYAMNRTAIQVFKKTFDEMYMEWIADAVQNAKLEENFHAKEDFPTPSENLFPPYRHNKPRFLPNEAAFSYIRDDGYHERGIVVHDIPSNKEKWIVSCQGVCQYRWTKNQLYFMHMTQQDGYLANQWLYQYDRQSHAIKKIPHTRHIRAFDVDGNDVYFAVQNRESSQIFIWNIEENSPRLICEGRPFEQIDAIAAHNGDVVVSAFDIEKHQFDLAILDNVSKTDEISQAAQCKLKKLTDDEAAELDPVFDEKHRIYFSSAKSGNLDLYRMAPTPQSVPERLTHYLDGIQHPAPAPNGDVYFTTHTWLGTTIARFKSKDLFAHIPNAHPNDRPPHVPAPPALIQPQTFALWLSPEISPARPYRPWRWLWPLSWRPTQSITGDGVKIGLAFGASDPSGHHAYNIAADYHTGLDGMDYSLEYVYSGMLWDLQFSHALSQSRGRYKPTTRSWRTFDYQTFYAALKAARTWNLRTSTTWLAIGYEAVRTDPRSSLSWPRRDPVEYPTLPSFGWQNALSVEWVWSNMRQFSRSMFESSGLRLSTGVKFEAPWIGSDAYAVSVNASMHGAITMPDPLHHAVSATAFAGSSYSTNPSRMPFELSSQGVFSMSPQDAMLHGYASGSIRGRHFLYAKFAWNVRLWEPEIQISTLPVGFSRMGLGAFGEWGYAWNSDMDLKNSKYSIGGRLIFDFMVGYRQMLRFSLGYAYGFAEDGGHALFVNYEL